MVSTLNNTYMAIPGPDAARGSVGYFTFTGVGALHRCENVSDYVFLHKEGNLWELFYACKITHENIFAWFEMVSGIMEDEAASLFYLIHYKHMSITSARELMEDCKVFQTTLADYANNFFDRHDYLYVDEGFDVKNLIFHMLSKGIINIFHYNSLPYIAEFPSTKEDFSKTLEESP